MRSVAHRGSIRYLRHRSTSFREWLGASTEVVEQPGGMAVRNYSCPVASTVRIEPCVCRALAVLFSEATGQPAVE